MTVYRRHDERRKASKDLADKTAIDIPKKAISKDEEQSHPEYQKALSNVAHETMA